MHFRHRTAVLLALLVLVVLVTLVQFHLTKSQEVEDKRNDDTHTPQVVLGMARGYKWDALRNFVLSLRNTNFTGDIVLFQSQEDSSELLQQKLKQYKVHVEFCQPEYPYFFPGSLAYDYSIRHPIERKPTFSQGMTLRYPVYQLWLAAHSAQYTDVFMSDTRDVVFQRDPFDWTQWQPATPESPAVSSLGEKVYAIIENTQHTIGSDWMNSEWIRRHYGHEGVSRIQTRHISCSGTTYGGVGAAVRYLARMTQALTGFILDRPAEVELNDQPIHNWLLHMETWDGWMEMLIDGRSPVATLALHKHVNVVRDSAGLATVLNADNSVPCVVHQYDRHQELNEAIVQTYQKLDYP